MALMFGTMLAGLKAGGAAAAVAGASSATAGLVPLASLAPVVSGVSAGTYAAGAAGGLGLSGLFSGAGGATSGVSTALTVLGGLAKIGSGVQQKRAAEQQAIDEETRATQEMIEGRQDALQALRAMNEEQAKIAAAGYASGIGSEGTVAAAQAEAAKVGGQNISMARENAAFQSAARRSSARQYRADGRGAVLGGIGGALSAGMSLFQRSAMRG